jgi:hypothetical protein
MKTTKQLVDEINASKICAPHFLDDVIDMTGISEITTIQREPHRWYEVGTVVFKTEDGFFGVRGPISLKSESMGYSDIGSVCEAFEMEEVPSVTYRKKSEH